MPQDKVKKTKFDADEELEVSGRVVAHVGSSIGLVPSQLHTKAFVCLCACGGGHRNATHRPERTAISLRREFGTI